MTHDARNTITYAGEDADYETIPGHLRRGLALAFRSSSRNPSVANAAVCMDFALPILKNRRWSSTQSLLYTIATVDVEPHAA